MILIIGAGAVGTIVTAHLLTAAREPVRLYVRDKDRATMQAVGQLRVDQATPGQAALVVAPPEPVYQLSLQDVDYVLLAVKFPQLAGVLDALGPIPEHCTLVSTLNGVRALRLIRERHPQARVAPMTIMFNGQLLGPLHAQITTRPQLLIGSDDRRLLAAFKGSGMRVSRAQGDASAWGKLLINLANPICALTHTTFRDLLTQPDLRAVYVAVLDEATRLLTRAGIDYQLPMPIPYTLYRHLLAGSTRLPWWFARARNGLQDGAYPSMVADIESGRPTEIGELNGEIVRLGETHQLATPVNRDIVALIREIEGQAAPHYLSPAALRARLRH
jgi:2-dehydropantoate 2-reductase